MGMLPKCFPVVRRRPGFGRIDKKDPPTQWVALYLQLHMNYLLILDPVEIRVSCKSCQQEGLLQTCRRVGRMGWCSYYEGSSVVFSTNVFCTLWLLIC